MDVLSRHARDAYCGNKARFEQTIKGVAGALERAYDAAFSRIQQEGSMQKLCVSLQQDDLTVLDYFCNANFCLARSIDQTAYALSERIRPKEYLPGQENLIRTYLDGFIELVNGVLGLFAGADNNGPVQDFVQLHCDEGRDARQGWVSSPAFALAVLFLKMRLNKQAQEKVLLYIRDVGHKCKRCWAQLESGYDASDENTINKMADDIAAKHQNVQQALAVAQVCINFVWRLFYLRAVDSAHCEEGENRYYARVRVPDLRVPMFVRFKAQEFFHYFPLIMQKTTHHAGRLIQRQLGSAIGGRDIPPFLEATIEACADPRINYDFWRPVLDECSRANDLSLGVAAPAVHLLIQTPVLMPMLGSTPGLSFRLGENVNNLADLADFVERSPGTDIRAAFAVLYRNLLYCYARGGQALGFERERHKLRLLK